MARRRSVGVLAVVAAVLALLSLGAAPASAAAPTLVSSSPGDGTRIWPAPNRIGLTFNFVPDAGSTMSVSWLFGAVDTGTPTVSGQTLTASLPFMLDGLYTVNYRAVQNGGAAIVTGSVIFRVGLLGSAPKGQAPTVTYAPTPPAAPKPTVVAQPTVAPRPTVVPKSAAPTVAPGQRVTQPGPTGVAATRAGAAATGAAGTTGATGVAGASPRATVVQQLPPPSYAPFKSVGPPNAGGAVAPSAEGAGSAAGSGVEPTGAAAGASAAAGNASAGSRGGSVAAAGATSGRGDSWLPFPPVLLLLLLAVVGGSFWFSARQNGRGQGEEPEDDEALEPWLQELQDGAADAPSSPPTGFPVISSPGRGVGSRSN